MQKFSMGEESSKSYLVKFDGEHIHTSPFKLEWLDNSFPDKKKVEEHVNNINSLFKQSLEYYCSSLYESPSSISRRWLYRDAHVVLQIFSDIEEIGFDESVVKSMLRDLFVSKFELGNAVEALIEANYYSFSRVRTLEHDVITQKDQINTIRQELDWMKIEIKKLKDDANIQ